MMIMRGTGALLVATLALMTTRVENQDCSKFKKNYCPVTDRSVIMVDNSIRTPEDCQAACFSRDSCSEFTYFRGGRAQCVLYRGCDQQRRGCSSCITGPLLPRVSQCPAQARLTEGGGQCATCAPSPCIVCQLAPGADREVRNSQADDTYDDSDDDQGDDTGDESDEDDVNIDDGLLDDVFEESSNSPAPRNNNPQCNSCSMAVCVMGGANDQGAVSEVASVTAGSPSPRTPRGLYISPSFMTQGSGQTFSFYARDSLMSCTPAYTLTTVSPYTRQLSARAVPGSCNMYDFSTGQWTSRGGPMSSFRQAGSLVRVGSYLMALAGTDQAGQLSTQVELFDPRRPRIGWQEVPRYRMARGVTHTCSLVTRDPRTGPMVMVTGGRGQGSRVSSLSLASNTWQSVARMRHARSHHACISLNLNGRPGVLVSGGKGNGTSVEFWDQGTNQWTELPGLSRGRRSHSMTTIRGQIAVAGGVGVDARTGADTETLDDVEIFDGKRWRRATDGLDQPRRGANLVKIPFTRFRGRG